MEGGSNQVQQEEKGGADRVNWSELEVVYMSIFSSLGRLSEADFP